MKILNEDKTETLYTKTQSNNLKSTNTIVITEEMKWIEFVVSSGTISHGRIYEITIE